MVADPIAISQPRLQIVRKDAWIPEALRARLREYHPATDLGRIVLECFRYLPYELATELLDRLTGAMVAESSLALTVVRFGGGTEDYGVVGRKLITTAGVVDLAARWVAATSMGVYNFHALGTSNAGENTSQTTLGAELTTQYSPDNTRATGVLSVVAGFVVQSVGTNTVDAGVTVAEHGLFSSATRGAGTLWDRTAFGNLTLNAADGVISTYQATFTAGG